MSCVDLAQKSLRTLCALNSLHSTFFLASLGPKVDCTGNTCCRRIYFLAVQDHKVRSNSNGPLRVADAPSRSVLAKASLGLQLDRDWSNTRTCVVSPWDEATYPTGHVISAGLLRCADCGLLVSPSQTLVVQGMHGDQPCGPLEQLIISTSGDPLLPIESLLG